VHIYIYIYIYIYIEREREGERVMGLQLCYIGKCLLIFTLKTVVILCLFRKLSRDSSLGKVNTLRAGRRRNHEPVPSRDKGLLSSLQRPYGLWSPSCLLFTVYWDSFPGVQRPGREALYAVVGLNLSGKSLIE
jgi:hypothetical protein